MHSIAHHTIHTPLRPEDVTYDKDGKAIARPKMVYDPEKGFIMFDDPDNKAARMHVELDEDTLAQHQLWLDRLTVVAKRAHDNLPDSATRIAKAVQLVEQGHISDGPQAGTFVVRSMTDPEHSYSVGEACPCEDYPNAPRHYCKHRLAAAFVTRIRAMEQGAATGERRTEGNVPSTDTLPSTPLGEVEAGILQHHTFSRGDTRAIRYSGLLLIAKQRGLIAIEAHWTYNDSELSLAEAKATFKDGSFYLESGDATPQNVTKLIAPHFRRMALTRAKARALRDALGIDMVALEELGEL
jgi:hypothetical protein